MPSKISAALVNDYTDALRSVLACLAKEPLKRITTPFESGRLHSLILARNPARLLGSELSFGLWQSVSEFWNAQTYRWTLRLERYRYEIVDGNAHELFAFHWDPLLKITFPHMHLGFGMRGHDLPIDNKAHIPTGRVVIADVIYFLSLRVTR